MVMAVPVSVILVPAFFPLCVQIAPPLLRLVATFPMLANRFIELRFRALDLVLAMGMVIGIQLGAVTNIAVPKAVVIAVDTASPLRRCIFKQPLLSEFG